MSGRHRSDVGKRLPIFRLPADIGPMWACLLGGCIIIPFYNCCGYCRCNIIKCLSWYHKDIYGITRKVVLHYLVFNCVGWILLRRSVGHIISTLLWILAFSQMVRIRTFHHLKIQYQLLSRISRKRNILFISNKIRISLC